MYEYTIRISKDEDERFVDMFDITVLRNGVEFTKFSGLKSALQNLMRLAADLITDRVQEEMEALCQ